MDSTDRSTVLMVLHAARDAFSNDYGFDERELSLAIRAVASHKDLDYAELCAIIAMIKTYIYVLKDREVRFFGLRQAQEALEILRVERDGVAD